MVEFCCNCKHYKRIRISNAARQSIDFQKFCKLHKVQLYGATLFGCKDLQFKNNIKQRIHLK